MSASIRSATADLPTHCWPIDKDAARVILPGDAERFTSKKPHTLCPVSVAEIQRRVTMPGKGTTFADLTGQRNGAMRIVGLIDYREGRRSSWSALCDCGNYEQRNHRFWQKYLRKGVPDACAHCMPMDLRAAVINAILGDGPRQHAVPRADWKNAPSPKKRSGATNANGSDGKEPN